MQAPTTSYHIERVKHGRAPGLNFDLTVREGYDVPTLSQTPGRSSWATDNTPAVPLARWIPIDHQHILSDAARYLDGSRILYGLPSSPWIARSHSEMIRDSASSPGRDA